LRKNCARFWRPDRNLCDPRSRSDSALNIVAQFDVLPGRKTVTIMNRTTFTLLLAAAASVGAARAQTQTQANAPVAQPSSPAPVVVQPPAPAATSTPTGVTQIVYSPKLPTAEELTNAATAQGYTVEKIVQTANQVIAFYRTANGQATTVAYQSLPPSGTAAPAAATTTTAAPAVVVTSPPPTTVVYETAPRVVYYNDYPRYYYPRVWYPPVSLSFGFGYRSHHGGFHHHHHHGGFRRW
jgi:hypothetical protein